MKISLRRRHTLLVQDGALSHKINYVTILNLEGHPNRITGSKVMAILLNGWSCIGKGVRLQSAQQACFKMVITL